MALLALASSVLGLASAVAHAQGRDVEVRFLAPGDPIDGYRLYLYDETTGMENMLDLGMVAPDGQGVGAVVLSLNPARRFEIEMTAYNAFGESSRSNAIQVAAQALSVDPILAVYAPGKHVITVTGSGFTRKPKIKFENGEGKRPKAKVRQVLDENTLEVLLKVKKGKTAGRSTWDMRVQIKGGEEIVVPDAVTVDSL